MDISHIDKSPQFLTRQGEPESAGGGAPGAQRRAEDHQGEDRRRHLPGLRLLRGEGEEPRDVRGRREGAKE